jgi:N-methylhydantoinase B
MINEGRESEIIMPSKGLFELRDGDTYTLYASGGGGWGDPLDRDPQLVRDDVRNDFVSLESAKRDYGVALTDDLKIDLAVTSEIRARLKASAG